MAKSRIDKLPNARLCFSLLTIDEVINAIKRYKLAQSKILKAVRDHILDLENLEIVSYEPALSSLKEYLEVYSSMGLKPRDSLHLHIMRENMLDTIATFDTDFISKKSKLEIKIV